MALDAQASRWSFADTQQSGVYRVELGAPVSREESFAVNVDTSRERSDAGSPPTSCPRSSPPTSGPNLDEADSPSIGRRSGLHKSLLYCVLGSAVCRDVSGLAIWTRDAMNGILPNWLEQWLGVEAAGPGEGTIWSLENTWSWAPWVTLLLAMFAVGWVVLLLRPRRRRRPAGWPRPLLVALRLALIAIVVFMIAEFTLSLRRTGLPTVAVADRRFGQHGHRRSLRRQEAARAGRQPPRGGRARAGEPAESGQDRAAWTTRPTCWRRSSSAIG